MRQGRPLGLRLAGEIDPLLHGKADTGLHRVQLPGSLTGSICYELPRAELAALGYRFMLRVVQQQSSRHICRA